MRVRQEKERLTFPLKEQEAVSVCFLFFLHEGASDGQRTESESVLKEKVYECYCDSARI